MGFSMVCVMLQAVYTLQQKMNFGILYYYIFMARAETENNKISNDQELIQSDPIFCPQNQKGNN